MGHQYLHHRPYCGLLVTQDESMPWLWNMLKGSVAPLYTFHKTQGLSCTPFSLLLKFWPDGSLSPNCASQTSSRSFKPCKPTWASRVRGADQKGLARFLSFWAQKTPTLAWLRCSFRTNNWSQSNQMRLTSVSLTLAKSLLFHGWQGRRGAANAKFSWKGTVHSLLLSLPPSPSPASSLSRIWYLCCGWKESNRMEVGEEINANRGTEPVVYKTTPCLKGRERGPAIHLKHSHTL